MLPNLGTHELHNYANQIYVSVDSVSRLERSSTFYQSIILRFTPLMYHQGEKIDLHKESKYLFSKKLNMNCAVMLIKELLQIQWVKGGKNVKQNMISK